MKRVTVAILACLALALVTGGRANAGDDASVQLTFYKDVLPIFQNSCQTCHRPEGLNMGGMVAPMAFTTYQEVRPWVKSIAKEVAAKRMPPWHAAPEFHGIFENDRALSSAQIETITKWAATGAPEGEINDAPPKTIYANTEWSFGEPDLVVSMPKPYFVKDEVEDQYINFTTEIGEADLPEDRYLSAIEFRAGGPVVHHIIGYAIAPGSSGQMDRGMIGGIAPGNESDAYPDGYGVLLRKGTKIVFAMHYHKEAGPGTGVWDESKVAFKFHDKPVTHRLRIDAIGNHDFEIPPGHPNWQVGSARVFSKDTTILELMPHMHLRGKDAKYVAFYPDGTRETLLHVPQYDFNWQTSYKFKEPKKIPAGTRIEVTMHFNNSTENKANPDHTKSIRFGGPTTDEMMLGWLTYADTEPNADKKADVADIDPRDAF